jgi:cytoskeletal protein RodZ
MTQKSFAIATILAVAVALMSTVFPTITLEQAYAEEDEHNDEEEYTEDESSDETDEETDDEEEEYTEDEDSNGDSSETSTEQEMEQKNVCSGWAVCVNTAGNTEDSKSIIVGNAGAADSIAQIAQIPMLIALPF